MLAAQFSAAHDRLSVLIPLGLGFLLGTATGALGYLWFGLWCLALVLWDGFVRSFEKGFTIKLPEDIYGSKRVLLAESNKPLWGMWWAFEELGRAYISSYKDNESISIYPYKSWVRLKKQV